MLRLLGHQTLRHGSHAGEGRRRKLSTLRIGQFRTIKKRRYRSPPRGQGQGRRFSDGGGLLGCAFKKMINGSARNP